MALPPAALRVSEGSGHALCLKYTSQHPWPVIQPMVCAYPAGRAESYLAVWLQIQLSPAGRDTEGYRHATACHSDACRVLAAIEEPHALVLNRVAGQPLAQKPNLQVLLRCRWAPGLEFRAAWIAGVAHGVASALAYLHAHCICHGGCCPATGAGAARSVLKLHPHALTAWVPNLYILSSAVYSAVMSFSHHTWP